MAVSKLVPVSGGVTQKVQEFTSTGTFTVPSNCSSVEVFLVSGGGGGGGAGITSAQISGSAWAGGGGGGVTLKRMLTVTPGQSYTVTIGAGGSAGTSSANSTAGGSTSFGSLLTAAGGGGGMGTQANGNVYYTANINGGTGGGAAFSNTSGNQGCGGIGGSTIATVVTEFGSWSASATTTGNGTAGQGTRGMPSRSSEWPSTANFVIGTGLENYGNAGTPVLAGNLYNSNTNILSWGNAIEYGQNRIGGSSNVQINGVSGSANTGNGGNGAAVGAGNPGVTTNATGGAGGSGYARITFWS